MKKNPKYDVVIIGGGTSGCACAYNCAKNGLKTLLVEKNNFLGGLMTGGLVIPIMKSSNGLPTYHFAHLVDDHFMHTTTVTRGEEWLPSLPIHLELFSALNFETPSYAHLPVIMKLDNGNRRKLSKRKDNEAAVSFFLQSGYPIQGFIEYLMTIANSNYEEWRTNNPTLSYLDFPMSFEKCL